jgi:hypothetical protein
VHSGRSRATGPTKRSRGHMHRQGKRND